MEPYSTDQRVGGSSPAVPPPPAPAWGGQSGQGGQGTPAWGGQAGQGTPAWAVPNAGMSPSSGVTPYAQTGDSKWPALRLIAKILKIVAWVEGGLGALSALITGGTLAATVGAGGFLIALFLLVVVAVTFLMTYAASEIIMLFISIEKNTREK